MTPFPRTIRGISNLVILFPMLAAIGLICAFRDKLADWWFRRVNARKLFLICSRRNSWHDFLVNNLLPVLPASISVVWFEPGSGSVRARSFPASFHSALKNCERPVLIAVTSSGFRVVPLDRELMKWKPQAHRSAAVQSQIRQILDAALAAVAKL